MKPDKKTLLLPLLLIAVGAGWLLTTLGIAPGIDWVWTLGLAVVGLLTFAVGGFDKVTVVIGPFFILASCLSSGKTSHSTQNRRSRGSLIDVDWRRSGHRQRSPHRGLKTGYGMAQPRRTRRARRYDSLNFPIESSSVPSAFIENSGRDYWSPRTNNV